MLVYYIMLIAYIIIIFNVVYLHASNYNFTDDGNRKCDILWMAGNFVISQNIFTVFYIHIILHNKRRPVVRW